MSPDYYIYFLHGPWWIRFKFLTNNFWVFVARDPLYIQFEMPSTHPLYPVLLSTGSTVRFYYHLWYAAEVGGSASVGVCVCVCVCVYLSGYVCQCFCLSVCVSFSVCLSIFLIVCRCVYWSEYGGLCLCMTLSVCVAVDGCLSDCVSECVCIRIYDCVSVYNCCNMQGKRTPRVLILGHITGLWS